MRDALSEFRVGGVPTYIPILHSFLGDADCVSRAAHKRSLKERVGKLIASVTLPKTRWFESVGTVSAARLAGTRRPTRSTRRRQVCQGDGNT
jgi:hypothetical protein